MATKNKEKSLQKYYKFHALIYDSTRWTFLFGRKSSYQHIPFQKEDTFRLLEVGCGTGMVLKQLALRFPNAQIIGLDLSADMVQKARKKLHAFKNIEIVHQAFDENYQADHAFDVILMSYSLSMIEPYWNTLWKPVDRNLKKGGYFEIVDFHRSKHHWFTKWMGVNHVYMQGHWPTWTETYFQPKIDYIQTAYGGLWEYRLWVGAKL